ncbi:MAG: K+/H+ antiporter subunit F [Rhodoferax sp.]
MLSGALNLAASLVLLAIAACIFRLIQGPSFLDRILALDTLSINTIALCLLIGLQDKNPVYFEAALLIALVGFVTTVTLTKFLLRADIIE